MAGNIFMRIFKGRKASDFQSVTDVNRFIKEETGREVVVKNIETGLCKNRGTAFRIQKTDADKKIDKALKHLR